MLHWQVLAPVGLRLPLPVRFLPLEWEAAQQVLLPQLAVPLVELLDHHPLRRAVWPLPRVL